MAWVIKFKTGESLDNEAYYSGRTYVDENEFRQAYEVGLSKAKRFESKEKAVEKAARLRFVCDNVFDPTVEEVLR